MQSRSSQKWLTLAITVALAGAIVSAQDAHTSSLRVVLLGTGAGPVPNPQRFGISTLVIAGDQRLLFDCGRAATIRMNQLGIAPGTLSKLFLTHLHSDHVIGIPDLYLSGWASYEGRKTPLQVWGPAGTRAMMEHLKQAFSFDIHIRRDVDEKLPPDGIKFVATDVQQGVVYGANGLKVTAFLVDHGPVKPAFGYRVDYRGRSVVMSGDTMPSDNLVKFSAGVDLLIHEVGPRLRHDPTLPPVLRAVIAHHTDPIEAGQIFSRVQPKLAVFSHGGNPALLPLVRQNYPGPVEIGEDLMTIDVGKTVEIHRFKLNTK
jgi:ribonuclease Z